MDDSHPPMPACATIPRQLVQLCSDPGWLQNGIAIEQEFCDLVNGGQLITGYAEVVQQVIQDMETGRLLVAELKTWLASWQLGSGEDAAFAVGRELLRSRIETMDCTQRIHFKALLVDSSQGSLATRVMSNRALSLVLELLTDEDLKAIARASNP